jgi:hypothetical protein
VREKKLEGVRVPKNSAQRSDECRERDQLQEIKKYIAIGTSFQPGVLRHLSFFIFKTAHQTDCPHTHTCNRVGGEWKVIVVR